MSTNTAFNMSYSVKGPSNPLEKHSLLTCCYSLLKCYSLPLRQELHFPVYIPSAYLVPVIDWMLLS